MFAWAGLELDVPAKWRPVKITGDDDAGEVLFADLDRPLMGLRWSRPPRRAWRGGRAAEVAAGMMRAEVGRLSADVAADHDLGDGWAASRLFVEPEPPGRDVWVGLSNATRRAVQVVVHRRGGGGGRRGHDRLLRDKLLPSLIDRPADGPRRWAAFDLDVTVPGGYRLAEHALSAGDLRLSFVGRDGRRRLPLTVRQVRPARLALSRRPMGEWLGTFAWQAARFHKPLGPPVADGDRLTQPMRRRRRYGWLASVAPELVASAWHDRDNDRLLLLRGRADAVDSVGSVSSLAEAG